MIRNGRDTMLASIAANMLTFSRALTMDTSSMELKGTSTIEEDTFCLALYKPWTIPPTNVGSRNGTRKILELESAAMQWTAIAVVVVMGRAVGWWNDDRTVVGRQKERVYAW